jgi:hypothetical protein
MGSYEAVDLDIYFPATGTVEAVIGASKQTISVRIEQFILPECIGVQDILYIYSRHDIREGGVGG